MRHLVDAGAAAGAAAAGETVAVLTPHRAQRRALEAALRQHMLGPAARGEAADGAGDRADGSGAGALDAAGAGGVGAAAGAVAEQQPAAGGFVQMVDTVERLQGGEADAVVFSATVSDAGAFTRAGRQAGPLKTPAGRASAGQGRRGDEGAGAGRESLAARGLSGWPQLAHGNKQAVQLRQQHSAPVPRPSPPSYPSMPLWKPSAPPSPFMPFMVPQSCTRPPPPPRPTCVTTPLWPLAAADFYSSMSRANVAFSRARRRLVVVCSRWGTGWAGGDRGAGGSRCRRPARHVPARWHAGAGVLCPALQRVSASPQELPAVFPGGATPHAPPPLAHLCCFPCCCCCAQGVPGHHAALVPHVPRHDAVAAAAGHVPGAARRGPGGGVAGGGRGGAAAASACAGGGSCAWPRRWRGWACQHGRPCPGVPLPAVAGQAAVCVTGRLAGRAWQGRPRPRRGRYYCLKNTACASGGGPWAATTAQVVAQTMLVCGARCPAGWVVLAFGPRSQSRGGRTASRVCAAAWARAVQAGPGRGYQPGAAIHVY